MAEVRWALTELEVRTGLEVRLGDDTSETVDGRLSTRDWTVSAWTAPWQQRWAPVLIFASDSDRTPELAGRITAWTHVHVPSRGTHLVSGAVALDGDAFETTDPTAERLRLRALLLHELGHLVGLGHVEDADLAMHPHATPGPSESPGYRHGDRLGLAVAGRGPC